MFLAIINDTYSEVKAELSNQKNEFDVGDYFKKVRSHWWKSFAAGIDGDVVVLTRTTRGSTDVDEVIMFPAMGRCYS